MFLSFKAGKKFWISFIAVELLITCIAGFVYSRREKVELNYAQEDLFYDSGESGFYVDMSTGHSYVATPAFSLPKGLYTVEAEYEFMGGNGTALEVQYAGGRLDERIAKIPLKASGSLSCDFKVRYAEPLKVWGRLTGDAVDGDYILLRNVRVFTSPIATRNFLFGIVACFLLIDGLVILYLLKDKVFTNEKMKLRFKILFLLFVTSNIPLMTNYLFGNSYDMGFHLQRMEGISIALQNGVFPVKIVPEWLNGHGYAASVFYGDFLLYIPAVLRIFGVSIQAAYKFYIIFINALTIFIAYHCFSKMSNDKAGIVCTVVYSLNIYRLYSIFARGAAGEYAAMAFMPLVVYGLWRIYTLPEESKEHSRSWIPLTIGCSGIFLSHMLTTEITALFIILTVFVLWKKTIRKKTLLVFGKAVAAMICCNLWFLVPFLDYMFSGTYVINNLDSYTPYKLEGRSAVVAQLFMTDYLAMGGPVGLNQGAIADMPRTVGCAAMAALAGWIVLCFGKKERNISEKKEEYLVVFLIALSLFMTTYLFPYTWFVDRIPILKMSVKSLQYPWRFLVISGLLLAYLSCIILKKEWIAQKHRNILAGLLLFLSVWQGISYMSECLNTGHIYQVYQAGELDFLDVGYGEYIPVAWDKYTGLDEYKEKYVDRLTYDTDNVQIDDWHREKNGIAVSLSNHSDKIAQVEVPLILYKGYYATADSGEKLQVIPGESYRVSVSVPAGFTGSFQVRFKEPWYWRVCEAVSLLTVAGIVIYMIRDKKKTGVLKKQADAIKC
ncbi:MAG: hypothetical protein NC231_11590 [Bacillus sp. (in: Bacteria)]|nr:hypothetical protein [Bacillus sp. (in: firmicutes)]